MEEILHFKISSGLKNIIGRELINDKFIAIFELVKNSYDAGASSVKIIFKNLESSKATITIQDNGSGMNKADLINKWLFVAYSEKRNPSYRDKIKRAVAGAKGVGRFSCDRLGESVMLESKTKTESYKHKINIRWSDFEKDSLDNFSDINVRYNFAIDNSNYSGTSIVISELRENWKRADLLALKKALAQMINPFATSNYDSFNIILQVLSEERQDQNETEDRNKVNGKIINNIFDILNKKTTKITVEISADGKKVITDLNDRGTHLFTTIEKNEFTLRNITCRLFFLNRAAKVNFTNTMGTEAINYGSIFVYKNDFRVFPYGEPGQDFFDIDQRKQQGYKRFLGTRELIGQIVIDGSYNDLNETSSRNNGFINSPHLAELKLFFMEYVLKPLEKYVVQIVQWGDTDSFFDSIKKGNQFDNLSSIIKKIKTRTKDEAYLLIKLNPELPLIISNYRSETSVAVKELRELATATKNDEILKSTEKIEKQTQSLEKLAREANYNVQVTQDKLDQVEIDLNITKKQVGVLDARADLTAKDAIDALHVMKGYADTIDSVISEVYELPDRQNLTINEITPYLIRISQICRKIMNSYNIVVRTRYQANTDTIKLNIIKFIKDYFEDSLQSININIKDSNAINQNVKFNPLELSVILDNLINNAFKANAKKMDIVFEDYEGGLVLRCLDDGYGLNPSADPERLFEPGYSTTNGSGIGMSTIKKYIEKIGGRVVYNPEHKDGFEILLYFKS